MVAPRRIVVVASPPDEEETLLAELWLNHFGHTLPLFGAKEVVRQILLREGVEIPTTKQRSDTTG